MSLDKSGKTVRTMFSDIAWRYDLLNHLLSANQDVLWRRRAVKRLCPRRGEHLLDLCCGTGDLGFEIRRQQPACRVTGADFALPMLSIASQKGKSRFPVESPQFTAADALRLPFEDATFDAVTVGFGVRNFEDTRQGVNELLRVLKPGGRLLVLEFMRPVSPVVQQFFAGFNLLFAPVGRVLSGHASAYNYLPQSIGGFYNRPEFESLLRAAGFESVRSFDHSGGVATSFLAARPHASSG